MLQLPNRNREVHMSQKTRIFLREMNSWNSQSFATPGPYLEQRFANLLACATLFFIHVPLQSSRPVVNMLIVNIGL
jgi:hypothetical protein